MTPSLEIRSAITSTGGRPVYQSAETSTFSIERPAIKRKQAALDSACDALLDLLAKWHPVVLLCAAKDSSWRRLLHAPVRVAGDLGLWSLHSLHAFHAGDEAASQGGWALCFFDASEEIRSVPTALATDGQRLESILLALDAKALVVSWYDDTEWLVTIRNE